MNMAFFYSLTVEKLEFPEQNECLFRKQNDIE